MQKIKGYSNLFLRETEYIKRYNFNSREMLPSDLLNIVRSYVPFEAELLSHCEKLHPTTLESLRRKIDVLIAIHDYLINPRHMAPYLNTPELSFASEWNGSPSSIFGCNCQIHPYLYNIGSFVVELCTTGYLGIGLFQGWNHFSQPTTKITFDQLMNKHGEQIGRNARGYYRNILYESAFGQIADNDDAWGLVFDIFFRNFKSES